MAQFHLIGTDANTKQPVTITVDADSALLAVEKAEKMGVLTARLLPENSDPHTAEIPPPAMDIADVIPFWKKALDNYKKLSSFFHTRKSVKAHNHLWDYSKERLKRENLMEPWPFNLFQSVFSAMPAVILFSLFKLLFPPPIPKLGTNLNDIWPALPLFNFILNSLTPFLIPISLAMTSFAASRGCLQPADRTPTKLARAQRAYLYLDGAYGLWPQMLAPFIQSFWMIIMATDNSNFIEYFIGLAALITGYVGLIWQWFLTEKKIPTILFEMNGYPIITMSLKFWQPETRKSWIRYWLWVTWLTSFILALIYIGLRIVTAIGSILIYTLFTLVKNHTS